MSFSRIISSGRGSRSLFFAVRGLNSATNQTDISRIHHGRVALVTGSSDAGGIGIAIARSLAQRGCSLILTGSRNPEAVDKLKTELEQYDISSSYIPADLTDLTSINNLYEEVKDIHCDGVDILVNNAGIIHSYPVEDFPIDIWERELQVNLTAPFYLIQLTLADMKRKGWGRVISISSITGLNGSPQLSAYSTSHHGLNGLTKVVALETLGSGVTCNAICPATVNTQMLKRFVLEQSNNTGMSEEEMVRNIIEETNPSGQFVEQSQIGELAAFLCSPAADQMTGTTIPIDAGFTAQ